MGELDFMKEQIKVKVKDGFKCIKIKIGAIDFESELGLLRWIRSEYAEHELELRVDANGAFSPSDAIEKLNRLGQFGLHSIEQPIAPKSMGRNGQTLRKHPNSDCIGRRTNRTR